MPRTRKTPAPASGTTKRRTPGPTTTPEAPGQGARTRNDDAPTPKTAAKPAATTAAKRAVAPRNGRPPGTGVAASVSSPASTDGKLRPGQLQSLVLEFVNAHPDQDWSASQVAHALARSSGAVGNALETFAERQLVARASVSPRRYRSLTAQTDAEPASKSKPGSEARATGAKRTGGTGRKPTARAGRRKSSAAAKSGR